MRSDLASAARLHHNVPPDWYYKSIRINPLQRFWHQSRFKQVSALIEQTNGIILDIGCADGVFTKVILDKSNAKKIIGIDVLKDSVNWAKKHWSKNKKLSFRLGNAHNLQFKNNTFDAVFALEVMEHVPDPQKVLNEIKRVLKKGGYAIILVPSDNLLFRIIWFFWTKFSRGKIWDDCHIQSFSKQNTLSSQALKAGFGIKIDKKFLLGMLNVIKIIKK